MAVLPEPVPAGVSRLLRMVLVRAVTVVGSGVGIKLVGAS